MVRDKENQKISKSKGNVIDPMEMIEKYGADALRMGMMMGTAAGQDTHVDENKIRAYRNFANKIWNAARFINMSDIETKNINDVDLIAGDKALIKEFDGIVKKVTSEMDKYFITGAGDTLYHYFWHRFCDECIENAKEALLGDDAEKKISAHATLSHILKNSLIMLHPFVPFVTEAVWQELYGKDQLITQNWPK